ncbi:DUF3473 domain-containing protein [Paenibacillus xanthanilyticus]|uniref:DUF3473 domain-containing protein n=1 Tax=Paenibacillus xanthanilyticus TaxID=1783531 RepID=A0ABV8KBE2_9BACL
MLNALTVDVEDYYMTSGLNIAPSEWPRYEDRVAQSTAEVLELFAQYGARGTFFILGCVAQRHPSLVADIARDGHEIGSHGGWHRLVTSQTPSEFRADVRFSKEVLEGITGRKVELYRAPSWSITPERYEALHILAEEGFRVDSSLQPFRTPLSGVAGGPRAPFRPYVNGRLTGLTEFPQSVAEMNGMPLPFSGGFYLRALPYRYVQWALKQVNRSRPGMIYLHPWELDLGQPRLPAPPHIRLVQYYGLAGMRPKLERLLRDFAFAPLGELIRERTYPIRELITAAAGGAT